MSVPRNENLRENLKALILSGLAERYVSTSSYQEIKTGNFYQTVQLGEQRAEGFRSDRSDLFAAFDFSGHRVLDCGSNIGELSRLARKRGAWLVDGYEYDPFFVQLASLINAFNDVTRVSFYQKDLTVPETFQDEFDIALAFSVFPYIRPVLPELTSHVTTALLLETHDVDDRIREKYLHPLRDFFPHHTFVKFTDHGNGRGQRAVFLLTKQETTLVADDRLSNLTIDLENSSFPFLTGIENILKPYRPIKNSNDFLHRADLKNLIENFPIDVETDISISDPEYWISFMKGYSEFKQVGYVAADNKYLQLFLRALHSRRYDPELSNKLTTANAVHERVSLRFRDADSLSISPQPSPVDPIIVLNPSQDPKKYLLRHGTFDATLYCDGYDGYHRIFWARLFGRARLRALFVFR